MDRWLFVTAILIIANQWQTNGFLFTPKFQVFLNQMRESGMHQDFVVSWDFNQHNNGFSYATNQNGKCGFFVFFCSILNDSFVNLS